MMMTPPTLARPARTLDPASPSSARRLVRLVSPLLLALLFTLLLGKVARADDRAPDAPAYRALQEGRVDDAATLLSSTLAAHPGDAMAHQLLCRVFYAQGVVDPAIHECELAVNYAPNASDNHLWLGRAYGMKAAHAGPIAGFGLARKVRASFERAVELDPDNVAALSDLGEFYVAAPSIVGGGLDKAQALAGRMMSRFPTAAHRILALAAQENGDLTLAETEFKAAVGPRRSPEALIDLARFFQKHNRPEDALDTIKAAIAADPAHDAVLVDAASILTDAHRAPQIAESALRMYLASPAKSDAAPAFKVHLQLSHLLSARGDTSSASAEAADAAALASGFHDPKSAQGS
jgi:tetratricopeptide (TPR) repeat protein